MASELCQSDVMELTNYVEDVRRGVRDAASLADEDTQRVAERLGQSLDSVTRLALIRALSDAASEISAELAPGSVEVRLLGNEPEFVVLLPGDSEPTTLITQSEPLVDDRDEDTDADEPTSRISLRVPATTKDRIAQAAEREGVSTNSWLIRAIQAALNPDLNRQAETSWPQSGLGQIFGAHGPFGPQGVFGANGVFGQSGEAGPNAGREGRSRRRHSGPGGRIQGWVR